MGTERYVYRVQHLPPGRPLQTSTIQRETPLAVGEWVTVDGAYVVVERIVPGRRRDPYDGLALCKLAAG
jgi:hypothetical protein